MNVTTKVVGFTTEVMTTMEGDGKECDQRLSSWNSSINSTVCVNGSRVGAPDVKIEVREI